MMELIEYFANPPKQILRYFDEDLQEKSLMCQTGCNRQQSIEKFIADRRVAQ